MIAPEKRRRSKASRRLPQPRVPGPTLFVLCGPRHTTVSRRVSVPSPEGLISTTLWGKGGFGDGGQQ